jgi:hypothetical protein
MKRYELIKAYKPIIDTIKSKGINSNNIQYLDLYDDFCCLKNRGHKITFVIATLSEKYSISERKIYGVIKDFETKIDC